MSEEIHRAPAITPAQLQAQQIAREEALENWAQVETEASFQDWVDDGAFNLTLMANRFRELETRVRSQTKKDESKKTEESQETLLVERIEEIAEQFERKNPELHTRALMLLRSRLQRHDSREEVLHKALEIFKDFSLADEALDFLKLTTQGDLAKEVDLAKTFLSETYGREVRAGRNMAEEARAFAAKGLGTPTSLRGIYRDITGNPRDANTLFNELSSQFEFGRMKVLIDFLLHSLGSDLKSKGPSIDHAELHRLITETRKLQSILGLYRFFLSRMDLIKEAFARMGIALPPIISFESLSRLFMKYLQERYPAADKILQMGSPLGLSREIAGQIVIFTQMRDGVRGVAPKLFKSEQHRQDVLKSFLEAIETLDDQLEEEEEEEKEHD